MATKRECPGCTATMVVFHVGTIELDRCPFCKGLWFDGGELEQVLKKNLVGVLDNTVTSRKCPACKVPMRPVELAGLQVDVCTTCRGAFLDDGELLALNGGKQVRVTVATQPAERTEAQAKDDVMAWLDTMGVSPTPERAKPLSTPGIRGIARTAPTGGLPTAHELPTAVECPQCNTPMQPFVVQSRTPDKDVSLDRCHNCEGVWFDAGELEAATGRSMVSSARSSDRFCPRCFIPLLNAELTGGVAVESCRTCKGSYLDARDLHAVAKTTPRPPPQDVSFVCSACNQRKAFSSAHVTAKGTLCSDCAAGQGEAKPGESSTFKSFVGWLRRD